MKRRYQIDQQRAVLDVSRNASPRKGCNGSPGTMYQPGQGEPHAGGSRDREMNSTSVQEARSIWSAYQQGRFSRYRR
jgi:hypothetical protein